MDKSTPITTSSKREQHRIEIRAEKISQYFNVKRQKFSPNSNNAVILQEDNIAIFINFYQEFKEILKKNDEKETLLILKKLRMMISEEKEPEEKIRNEVFKTEVYKDVINFVDPIFYNNTELLTEVLWILINLSCVSDEEKLKMLFKEKMITKLIKLLKCEENNKLCDDILWCLCNIIPISEEAKHDIINEGVLDISLKAMNNVLKEFIDFDKVKNFSILYYQCSQAKPAIKYEIIRKYLSITINIMITIKDNNILYPSVLAISNIFTNYGEFLKDTIQIFLTFKGLTFIKAMLDDKNTSKVYLIALMKIFGSIVNGNENVVQQVVDLGFLSNLNDFLIHSSLKLRHYTSWSLSNIIISNESLGNMVFLYNNNEIFERILKMIIIDEEIVKLEALFCIYHMMNYKKQMTIDFLLERNIIKLLINSIKDTESSKIILVVFSCLEKLFEFEQHTNKNYHIIIMKLLEESGGLQKLDELQHHPDDAVYIKLDSMLKRFFDTS